MNEQKPEIETVPPVRRPIMREFARPIIGTATLCIRLGEAERNYELRTIHFNQLPSFYGMPNENPLNFIREFYTMVQTFPLQGLNEDQLRMRCFLYTLKGRAKTWLMALAPNSLTTWDQVYEKFMGKFYSHQKTMELRTKIATFSQMDGEPFHEAWDRFKFMLIQCPHHHYPLELLNQFFYSGLTQQCQCAVDNAAGGDMKERTAEEIYDLFEMLEENSQEKSARGKRTGIYEVKPNHELTRQLAELTKQVQLLTHKVTHIASAQEEVCGICDGHGANVCNAMTNLQVGEEEQVNAVLGFQQRPKSDLYSNTYNPGWSNHPNFSSGENNQQYQQPSSQQRGLCIEESLNQFIQISRQHQEAMNRRFESVEASIQRVETQVEQLTSQLQNKLR